MKTYFISSDIHSFYDEYIDALKKQKFDINNPEHILIILGDIFDRGEKSLEIYNFLKNLPKERRILIRGNHEALLRELVQRGYAENHDDHNGTYATLFQLAQLGFKNEADMTHEYYRELARKQLSYGDPGYEEVRLKYRNLRSKLYKGKVKEVLDWIASDEWVNYYETNNYIFVHAWIPTLKHYEFDKWYIPHQVDSETYREDWRNATNTEWEDAMWPCPWQKAKKGLNKTNKIIVCGHWHTSDFFNNLTKQHKDIYYDCPIFKSKRYKLIGLDTCTAASHRVNVLKLTEEEL